MALTNLIPELWSATVDTILDEDLVFAQIANKNIVQGKGDIFHIVAAGDVTTRPYVPGDGIVYEDLSATETQVTLDKDNYFAFQVLDSDVAQSPYMWQRIYAARGAHNLADDIDTNGLTKHTQAGSNFQNAAGTKWQFTKDTAAEIPAFFAQLNKKAKTLNWPSNGRWLIAPPGFGEAVDLYTTRRETGLGDVQLGIDPNFSAFTYKGWTVFISNNCETESTILHGMAGLMGEGIAYKPLFDGQSVQVFDKLEGEFAGAVRARAKWGIKVYNSTKVLDVEFNTDVVATS